MGRYAVVSDKGVVTNTIEYDGVAEIYNDPKPVPIDDLPVSIGDKYLNGIFYLKPHDGYEYMFDTDSLEWNITDAGQEAKNADEIEFASMTKSA
ncbi:TPA: hypothetical protein ACPZNW_004536, partial [Yersinia enterocolitica]